MDLEGGSPERLAGTLVMAGLSGHELDDCIKGLIEQYHLRAFILFRRNIKGPDQLKGLCSSLKDEVLSRTGKRAIIAVDQEGGPVSRLAPPLFPAISSNADVGRHGDSQGAVLAQADETAALLSSVGINLNLAPVLDLALSGASGVLKKRCYSDRPERVARLGSLYIDRLQGHGIGAVAKHFPGIGRVRRDPHLERPEVDADQDLILQEALPFKEAIRAEVAGIMTSHVVFKGLDPALPVTYSRQICIDLLRKRFGFKGVLFSDDLEMGGIVEEDTIPQASIRAISCGHDMVLICSSYSALKDSLDAIARAIEERQLAIGRVLEAVVRIEGLASDLRP
jgi:beta-N-acetylhexosaminidase